MSRLLYARKFNPLDQESMALVDYIDKLRDDNLATGLFNLYKADFGGSVMIAFKKPKYTDYSFPYNYSFGNSTDEKDEEEEDDKNSKKEGQVDVNGNYEEKRMMMMMMLMMLMMVR